MFKKWIILFLVLLLFPELQAAVLSPQPTCVSVATSGDVTLTWIPSTDPASEFSAYLIYSAPALGGPYTLIDSVFSIATSSYIHVGANANIASVFYYVQTRYNGFSLSTPLDTVRSIHLSVTNPANGTAILNWNAIASPLLSTSTTTYNIYMEYPTGVWTLTGTTTGLSFIDTIFVCNSLINYRVEIADNTGCTSVSSIDGGTFMNIIVPGIPNIDTLSVDNSNTTLLNWNVNSSPDVAGYIVFVNIGTWIPVDTIYGINNTDYNYTGSTAGSGSEQYCLAAIDSCGNISPLGPSVSTIFLTSNPDICSRSAVLSWTAYSNFNTGLAGYHIYQATAGFSGPYTLIGTVGPAVLTFTASGLAASTNYFYRIEAFDMGGTKTVSSNRIMFFSAIPIPPTFSYLRSVSVQDPDRVNITCHVDVAASTLRYKIMRSLDTVSSHFSQVGSVPAGSSTPVTFTDTDVKTDKNSYYYKIINVDSCGYDGMETNVGRTILLNALSNSEQMTNTICWNDYENWSGNVLHYNIYRGLDGVMDPVPIATIAYAGTDTNRFTDDISNQPWGQGVYDYQIEAVEGSGNAFGFADTSYSNIAEAYQDPRIFLPNAFSPNGRNNVFKPVMSFMDVDDYEFSIFNRWGLKVFTSTEIDLGWDGTHHGSKSELGVYVYLLKFRNSKGEHFEKTGTVLLIR
jgi:gliding motility-associated-like protein